MRARTFVVALLGMMVLTAVGCGSGDGNKDSADSLTFWTAEDNPDRVKATQAIVDRFQQQTNIKVKLVAINEDQLSSQVNSASAAGTLPDLLAAASLGFVHSLAADNITDPDAAAAVINTLGPETFSQRGLSLVEANGKSVAIPSDSWTQLLVYRTDLFDKAGLAAPTTFEGIQAAAAKLTGGGMAGIMAATKAGDSFTQQTFEYLAVSNDCQLVDQAGAITLTSTPCVDTFQFYVDLIRTASVPGPRTPPAPGPVSGRGRHDHLVVVSPRRAGWTEQRRPPNLPPVPRRPVVPGRPQRHRDRHHGPPRHRAFQFGEVTSFAITKDASKDAAKLVEFMMNDGYLDWLALAPEGKVPVRTGTTDQPTKFTDASTHPQDRRRAQQAAVRAVSGRRAQGARHQPRHDEPVGISPGSGTAGRRPACHPAHPQGPGRRPQRLPVHGRGGKAGPSRPGDNRTNDQLGTTNLVTDPTITVSRGRHHQADRRADSARP